MSQSNDLGSEEIQPLLVKMAVPASIGILVMSIYMIVDTIFVGNWVGSLGIAAITVVMPIVFLISSIGMSIGIGGASIISRALGSDDKSKALRAFGNQVTMTLILATIVVAAGSFFQEEILVLFGGKGNILAPAKEYFQILLLGIPFLAWAMMSNNVIRGEGKPKIAMTIMLVPAILNIILDPILIIYFEMGIAGAAWATTISYLGSASYAAWFFFFSDSELKIGWSDLGLDFAIVKEIFAIGGVTFARQGTISILAIVLNNSLFSYGGEMAVSVYGIINRMMMFAIFPILGITQGFLPIAGFNYGAKKWQRVREVIRVGLRYGSFLAFLVFLILIIFTESIAAIFTNDPTLIEQSVPAMRLAFLATPLITFQLIGSAYFQAIGKAIPALLLTLTKQGFFLIPLILLLPPFLGLTGIWCAFPIADVLSAAVTYGYLRKELKATLEVMDDGEE